MANKTKHAVPQDKLEKLLNKTREDLTRNEMERIVLNQRLEVINDIIESFGDDDDEPVNEASFGPNKRGGFFKSKKKGTNKKVSTKKVATKRAYKKRASKKKEVEQTAIEPTNGNGHLNGTKILNKQPAEGLSWFQMAGKVMNRQKFMSAKEITDEIQQQFDLGERKVGTSISATLSGNATLGKLVRKEFEEGLKYKLA